MTAVVWLRDYLKTGKKEAEDVRWTAKAAGFTRRDLQAAKKELGVKTTNNWNREHPFTDKWYWSLPEDEG